jgi:hypothetical protein
MLARAAAAVSLTGVLCLLCLTSAAAAPAGPTVGSGTAAPVASKPRARSLISAIRINTGAPGEERLVFTIQGDAAPTVFFIEGDPLRLVLDFADADVAPGVPSSILPGGRMIRQVRLGVHSEPDRKVRVVLELSGGREYEIDEYFRPEEMIYELIVRPSGGSDPSGSG